MRTCPTRRCRRRAPARGCRDITSTCGASRRSTAACRASPPVRACPRAELGGARFDERLDPLVRCRPGRAGAYRIGGDAHRPRRRQHCLPRRRRRGRCRRTVGVVALEAERRQGDPPPVALLAQAHRVGDPDVGEEDLVERRPPLICLIGRTSMPGRSIGMMNAVMPWCLGDVGVGAGDQLAPLGELGARAPHLLAVDHPLVAVADSPAPRLARSEPAPGSENSWQHSSRAARNRGTSTACCSSVPNAMIVGAISRGRDAVRLVALPVGRTPARAGRTPGRTRGVAEAAVRGRRVDRVVAALGLQPASTPAPARAARAPRRRSGRGTPRR